MSQYRGRTTASGVPYVVIQSRRRRRTGGGGDAAWAGQTRQSARVRAAISIVRTVLGRIERGERASGRVLTSIEGVTDIAMRGG